MPQDLPTRAMLEQLLEPLTQMTVTLEDDEYLEPVCAAIAHLLKIDMSTLDPADELRPVFEEAAGVPTGEPEDGIATHLVAAIGWCLYALTRRP